MVSFIGLALIVAAVVAAVVVAVLGGSLLAGRDDRRRCSRCGSMIPASQEECTVCEAPFKDPYRSGEPTPEEPEAGEKPTEVRVETPEPDEEGRVVNAGVPHRLVRWAVILMFIGLGVRVLGMLKPAGLETGIPEAVTAALTVIGGIAMFAGFVVSDIA